MTGEKRVGKSTLINGYLAGFSGKVGGFRTIRCEESSLGRNAVYLVPLGDQPEEQHFLFHCPPAEKAEVWARFDELGCRALEASADCELLVMDELGPTEEGAEQFRQAVMQALDGDIPVIGVIQKANSAFLDAVKNHPQVDVVEVTLENRDQLGRRNLRHLDQRNSAGAVVLEDDCVLLCQGYYGWSFPKGKLEPGETPEQAAVREIFEETAIHAEVIPGFSRVVPSAKPGDTRVVTFFLGRSREGKKTPIPDEVAYARWVPVEQALEMIHYPPDLEVLKGALEAKKKPWNRPGKILVSACLLGENCKYNGKNNRNQKVIDLVEGRQVIPVCPEVMAGLGTPRTPIEIVNGVPMDRKGNNVAEPLRRAVEVAMELAKDQDIACAVLQSRSPTCGVNQVYDGSFTGCLIPGSGVFAQTLKGAGIPVVDAEDVE